ncbi:unnamed protein product [Cyprideis torosa]|uniref:Uncharacterized protein n=1 Tax=Cyprideis torosa TaxID=163714 RepID=A0A7R8WU15_9CRUS|nr:unnamed protein product [Cyprideis torosa]CAG0906381.1 unnamed protein product [Cyprideis torosa]
MERKGVVIAGLAGGSGKSIVSVGMAAYYGQKGFQVAPFKKGPDYIDAGWLSLAAKSPCRNLDPYLMESALIRDSFTRHSQDAEVVVVEGNRGLYDGVDVRGGYSTAELAKILELPVVLVVNCSKATRTVAALVLGCKMFDPEVQLAGVILNNVATVRQQDLITEAVATLAQVPVLGVIPRMQKDVFPMRHLGMLPHQEYDGCREALSSLAESFGQHVDTAALEKIMGPPVPHLGGKPGTEIKRERDLRIGIINDAAFQFYYPENLEALTDEGATLVPLNALKDGPLPSLDGLYIGGGFPETSVKELSGNLSFRRSVHQAAHEGLPIYAECGGLIYLGKSMEIEGRVYPLAGVFPIRFGMAKKPQAHGYTVVEIDKEMPYYPKGSVIKGHEFRYSTVLSFEPDESLCLVMKMKRGTGFSGGRDGLLYKNTLGLYTHVHAYATPSWAPRFINFCRQRKNEKK